MNEKCKVQNDKHSEGEPPREPQRYSKCLCYPWNQWLNSQPSFPLIILHSAF
jgi:hypothetical protein